MTDDFVLDALEILEKEGVIAGRDILRILARRSDDGGPELADLVMEPVDFGAGLGFEGEMMQCGGLSSIDGLVCERPAG